MSRKAFLQDPALVSLGPGPRGQGISDRTGSLLGPSGHIPGPGAVYFLFHSARARHVNFSRPNSFIIQTYNKGFHLSGRQRETNPFYS